MKKINDSLLIQLAEENLKGEKKKEIKKLIKTNKSIKKKYEKLKKTILILKKFGKSLEITKKRAKSLSLVHNKKDKQPNNIIKIAEYLRKRAI